MKDLIEKLNNIYKKTNHDYFLCQINHDLSLGYACCKCGKEFKHKTEKSLYKFLKENYIAITIAPYVNTNKYINAIIYKCPYCDEINWFHCSSEMMEMIFIGQYDE